MSYKRVVRCMAAVLAVGVLLCGCDGGSLRDTQTEAPHTGQVKEEQYLELVVEDLDVQGDKNGIPLSENTWTRNEEKRIFVTDDQVPYMIEKLETGAKTVQPWEENWKKKFKKKFIEPEWYYLLDERTLYIFTAEYSMDPKKFYDNREKHSADFYTTHYYLMRIDMTTGEMAEVPTPQVTYEEFFKKKGEALTAEMNGKEIYWYDIRMLPNGNFMLSDYQTVNQICNGITGEKLADIDFGSSGDGLLSFVAGDGFIAAVTGSANQNPHKYTLRFYDADTGKEQSSIPLDFEESTDEYGDPFVNYCMSASENTLAIVYKQGIYTMDYGDDQFEKVVDPEKDKTYYLPDEEMRYVGLCIGAENDFYVKMEKQSSGQQDQVCHYFKKGTEKNEG